jgi:2-dehydro-3-deoxygluconokinase
MDLVALGEPMLEFAAEERARLGSVQRFRRGWGGDTSNTVVAAARLGASTGYVSRIGGDEFGSSFMSLWKREGVDASRVVVEPEGFTGIYFISVRQDGEHDFTYYRNGSAASRLSPHDLDPEYLSRARILHTSGISQAISKSCRAAVEAAIDIVHRGGGLVSYDANVRPKLAPLPVLREMFQVAVSKADMVFVSEEDLGHLYPNSDSAEASGRVLSFGPDLVVLRRGRAGCQVLSGGENIPVPGWPEDPVDSTGAGDAFNAGFLVSWLEGRSLEEAARFANAVGALTVGGLGAVNPLPYRGQVERLVNTGAR